MTENQSSLDEVFKFSHIAGPGILHQTLHRRRIKIFARSLQPLSMKPQKMPGKNGDIFRPFSEWRHMNGKHIQPIVQITAKSPLLYCFLQIGIGRRNHPYIDRNGLGPAHAIHQPVLQNAQELRLRLERHFADFIEE